MIDAEAINGTIWFTNANHDQMSLTVQYSTVLGSLPEKCHKELPLLDNIYSNIFIDLQYK